MSRYRGLIEGVVYKGTFDSFDSRTGEHTFTFDNGLKQSFHIKGEEMQEIYLEPFVFEGAKSYFLAPVESKCTKCKNLLSWIIFLAFFGGATALGLFVKGDFKGD